MYHMFVNPIQLYNKNCYQFDRQQDILFVGVVEEEELSVLSLFLFKIFLKDQLFQLFLLLVEKQREWDVNTTSLDDPTWTKRNQIKHTFLFS